jgi:hypothetical protein
MHHVLLHCAVWRLPVAGKNIAVGCHTLAATPSSQAFYLVSKFFSMHHVLFCCVTWRLPVVGSRMAVGCRMAWYGAAVLSLALGVARAMAHLHSEGVIHGPLPQRLLAFLVYASLHVLLRCVAWRRQLLAAA